MPRELSLAVVAHALDVDVRSAVPAARRLGFAGLLFDAFNHMSLPDLSASGRREFLHLLSSHEQRLVGLRCDLGPRGFGPGADLDREIARIIRTMETAAALHAPLVCVDLGPLPLAPAPQPPRPPITPGQAGLIIVPTLSAAPAPETTHAHLPPQVDPTFVSQVDGAMADIAARADRAGVTVAFRSTLADFASLDRTLKAARCHAFGVDLDPVAILRDNWSADQVFDTLGSRVRHVYARDAFLGADARTQPAPVGAGTTDWSSMLSDLDAAGYHGWITADPTELPNRLAGAAAAVRHLRTA